MDSLTKRKEPNVISGLVQALRSKDPVVVNRAAWSLGQLKAVTTVPKLIPALITVQTHMIMPPIQGWPSGTSGSSFGSVSPTAGMSGSNFNNNLNSYGMVTPPGLGPGVAGYGATGIPGPSLPSATFSSGGNGPREQMPRILTLRFQNIEVLSSLVKLTGQDFGFDIPAWQQWVASGYPSRSDSGPPRSAALTARTEPGLFRGRRRRNLRRGQPVGASRFAWVRMNGQQNRVVIIGGGFGGLNAAQTLRHAPVRVILIDRHNHHLFQPLLYQVATAALDSERHRLADPPDSPGPAERRGRAGDGPIDRHRGEEGRPRRRRRSPTTT